MTPSTQPKKKYVIICPQCGSTDIGIPPAGMDIRLTYPHFCRKCKNRGVFPERESSDIENVKKRVKK